MIKTISWLALIIAVSANVASNNAFKMAVSRWTSDGEGHWWTLVVDPVFWIGLGLASVLLGSYLYTLRAFPWAAQWVSRSPALRFWESHCPRAILRVSV